MPYAERDFVHWLTSTHPDLEKRPVIQIDYGAKDETRRSGILRYNSAQLFRMVGKWGEFIQGFITWPRLATSRYSGLREKKRLELYLAGLFLEEEVVISQNQGTRPTNRIVFSPLQCPCLALRVRNRQERPNTNFQCDLPRC